MASERTGLVPWLIIWAYMVITLIVPLALSLGGVWTWEIATAVVSRCWLILFIVVALVQAVRPERRKRRSPRGGGTDAREGT